jgi:glycosyltransferase involved in cell wall biosynthesis
LVLWGDHYAALGIRDARIDDRGRYDRSDLNLVFESMDVLVVPSTWPETFGFVVVEALSFGLPVVCSDLVGASFLIEGISELLPYRASESSQLTKRLLGLTSSTTYACVVEKIRALHGTYTIKRHAQDMERLYELLRSAHD